MLSKKPHTHDGFEELMKEWEVYSSNNLHLFILPNILKSDIGAVLDHELPGKGDICFALMEINYAITRINKMVAYLEVKEVTAIKRYKHLLNDIKELLDKNIWEEVWDSVYFWIDEELNEYKIERDYAQRKTDCFAALISLLEDCFKLSIELNEKEREVSSC
ncbi:hypothetical protein [Pedobacter cryotolerans]|uniref:Uncharacterized protein n=1 Tax=Pedobacter cryotolerans TaxID=2571270 RepID=A0A4U1C716_9SPHI|nr:hypothetical protein [Pedobacter cryotolerans]TKC01224.1 hypothetical protein FA045_08240 [Pedobacter cryotolerans]